MNIKKYSMYYYVIFLTVSPSNQDKCLIEKFVYDEQFECDIILMAAMTNQY